MILLILVVVAAYNAIVSGLNNLGFVNLPSFQGYEDFVRLLISCSALMFFPITQFVSGHVSVDFFTDYMLSEKAKNVVDRIWLSLTFFLVAFLTVNMFDGMEVAKSDGVVTSVIQWNEWIFYIPGVISLVLWCLVLIYQIFSSTKPNNRDLDTELKPEI